MITGSCFGWFDSTPSWKNLIKHSYLIISRKYILVLIVLSDIISHFHTQIREEVGTKEVLIFSYCWQYLGHFKLVRFSCSSTNFEHSSLPPVVVAMAIQINKNPFSDLIWHFHFLHIVSHNTSVLFTLVSLITHDPWWW